MKCQKDLEAKFERIAKTYHGVTPWSKWCHASTAEEWNHIQTEHKENGFMCKMDTKIFAGLLKYQKM